MGRNVNYLNSIVVFNKDITAKDLEKMFLQGFKGIVVVNGDLILEKPMHHFRGDLYVMGDIDDMYYHYHILIAGNLYCYGSIKAGNIDVTEFLYSKGNIDAKNISVGEDLYCEGEIDSMNITVDGDFHCKEDIRTYFFEINVAGDLICEKNLTTKGYYALGKKHVGGTTKEYEN